MLRTLSAVLAVALIAVLVPGAAARADHNTEREAIEAKLNTILNTYLTQFRLVYRQIQLQTPANGQKLATICSAPERAGAFVDPKASLEDKIGAIATAADGFGAFASQLGSAAKVAQMVTVCRAVAPATGHYWSGAVFALLYSKLSGHRQENLLAAYYGSNILGATDFALAKQALEETAGPHDQDMEKLIGQIDDYEAAATP